MELNDAEEIGECEADEQDKNVENTVGTFHSRPQNFPMARLHSPVGLFSM